MQSRVGEQASAWGNKERVQTVTQALDNLPHNQIATGMGFRLMHDPSKCLRCRATICMLEISSILQHQEVSNVS